MSTKISSSKNNFQFSDNEYAYITMSADQTTGIADTNPIKFNTLIAGNITFDPATYRVTLKKNRTYRLAVGTYFQCSAAGNMDSYFYNVTGAAQLGKSSENFTPTYTLNYAGNPSAICTITPTVDTVVECRIGVPLNLTKIWAGYSYWEIQQINIVSPVIANTTKSLMGSITAYAGSGQANAYQLPVKDRVIIGTCATQLDSVKLPPNADVGTEIEIVHEGAKTANLYPAVGGDLGAGANAAVMLYPQNSIRLICTTANTTWKIIAGRHQISDQQTLTVTGTLAGYTTVRAIGKLHLDTITGVQRLIFNTYATVTNGAHTGETLTIASIVFKNTASFSQAVAAVTGGTYNIMEAYANANAGTITIVHTSTSTSGYGTSGDVELNSQTLL